MQITRTESQGATKGGNLALKAKIDLKTVTVTLLNIRKIDLKTVTVTLLNIRKIVKT